MRARFLRFFAGLKLASVLSAISLVTISASTALAAESEILVKYFDLTKGRIAFTYALNGKKEVYVLDFATLVAKPVITSNGDNDSPRFSKDGTKILFTSTRTGDQEIYVANSDGTGVKQLTNNKGGDWDPDWSPDGKQIVFMTYRDNAFHLSVMNHDGTGYEELVKLAEGKEYGCPRWAPTGDEIMYQTTEYWPGIDLLAYNLKTKRVTVLTTGNLSATRPAFAPDGQTYSYSFGSKEDTDIFLHKRDTSSKPVAAVTQPGLDLDSEWLQDGKRFLYVSETTPKSGHFEIFLYNVDTRESVQVTQSDGIIRNLSWTPTSTESLGKDKPVEKNTMSDATPPDGPPEMFPPPLPSPSPTPSN
ncbi:MAG: hypothetical protein U0136_14235 [Bdellovibrionota bacterium]